MEGWWRMKMKHGEKEKGRMGNSRIFFQMAAVGYWNEEKGWRVGWLGAMGFWLHAYHFKRPAVKCSLLLCTPSSIILCLSPSNPRWSGSFWRMWGLIVTVWYAVQFSFTETTSMSWGACLLALNSPLLYMSSSHRIQHVGSVTLLLWHPSRGSLRQSNCLNTTLCFQIWLLFCFTPWCASHPPYHHCAVLECHKNDLKRHTTPCCGPHCEPLTAASSHKTILTNGVRASPIWRRNGTRVDEQRAC